MLVGSMRMALEFHFCERIVGVHLVSGTELVMSDNVVWGDFGPARCTEKMLGFDGRVAEEERIFY